MKTKEEILDEKLSYSSVHYSFNSFQLKLIYAAMESYHAQFTMFTAEQMYNCFAEGVHAGIGINELPTPRMRFNEFMRSLTDIAQ